MGVEQTKPLLGSVGGEESGAGSGVLAPLSAKPTHTHTARWVLSKRAALKEEQTEKAVVLVPAHVQLCFPKGEFHSAVGGAGNKPHPAAPCAEHCVRAVLTAEQTHSSQVAILGKEADCQVNTGAAAFIGNS